MRYPKGHAAPLTAGPYALSGRWPCPFRFTLGGKHAAPFLLTALLLHPPFISTAAHAQSHGSPPRQGVISFDIEGQDLARALQLFARQAGVQLLFPYGAASGRKSQPVKGRMTARQALNRLLDGHDLRVTRSTATRITLAEAPARQARRLPSRPAQSTSPTPRPAPSPPLPAPPAEDIIVTGRASASPLGRTDYSYAVSTISSEILERRTPLSTAELFRMVPGFWVESSGGEAGNNVRSRGIPTDGFTSIALAENGIPVQYDGGLGYLNTDQSYRFDESLERIEVVRGGPSALFLPNAPGGVANIITRSGLTTQGGLLKITAGDGDYFRADGYYAGKIAENWGALIGGFYRRDGGRRRPGYVADEGGQIRAAINYDDGMNRLSVDLRHLDDRVTFYLPVPLRYDEGGNIRPISGFDPLHDSLSGPETLRLPIRTADGAFDFDLGKGTRSKVTAITLKAELQPADGIKWSGAVRWRTSETIRNALFPTGTPMTAQEYLSGIRAQTLDAFPQAERLVLRYVSDGAPFSADANGNGLLAGANLLSVSVPLDELIADSRISHDFHLGGQHDLALGMTIAHYDYRFDRYMGTILLDLQDKARLVDALALDGAGTVIGGYTDGGVQRHGSLFDQVDMTAKALALYAADEWQVSPRLRVDFGARWERSRISGHAADKHLIDLGDATTLADDRVWAPSGAVIPIRHYYSATGWSVGGNYRLASGSGLFARYTSSFRLPSASEYNTSPNRTDQATVPIKMAELGLSHIRPGLSLSATGFYTRFTRLPFTDFRFNTISNAYEERTAIADTETLGAEIEAFVRITPQIDLAMQATWQRPLYRNFAFTELVAGQPVRRDYSGHQLIRVPRLMVRAVPGIDLFNGALRTEATLSFYSRRYSDVANSQRLPAYALLGLDATARLTESLSLSLHATNLLNSLGLTEGNPRIGSFEMQAASQGYFFARPEFARSLRLDLKMGF